MIGEDVFVVADAVLDGVNQTIGHGLPGRLAEHNRGKVLDEAAHLEAHATFSERSMNDITVEKQSIRGPPLSGRGGPIE